MRRKKHYFKREPGAPDPLEFSFQRRARFGEVDAMAVMWHGHYATLFEEASSELRRLSGLGYEDFFAAEVYAPIVQLHVDYFSSLLLDELFTVKARMLWTDAARINIEYEVHKEDGSLAATGFTVQLFSSATTGEPCFTVPPLLEKQQELWKGGRLGGGE
ncbi:Putative esterase [Pontiella desulfatans]|uniref:Esterase n=1 Tax=Pontiella desulfatans TaxID=2750659 RepID=A0A6C2TXH6_PONDE|nr:acyl-CoA thioesterase [Pontiella desulfatans]VGO12041.1 Putative esterase [Pontiella desulfatans]